MYNSPDDTEPQYYAPETADSSISYPKGMQDPGASNLGANAFLF